MKNKIRNVLILVFVLTIGLVVGSYISKTPDNCAPDPYKNVKLMPYKLDGFYWTT
jgi:hypothetical protein